MPSLDRPSNRFARRLVPVALTTALVAGVMGGCPNDDEYEARRRIREGGVTTPALQAQVQAAIDALETDMGGAVEGSLADRLAFHNAPGVTVAVVNRGVVEWVEAWGTYDGLAGTPMQRRSPLQGGSLSKPTTALAMLELVEQGLIDLDAPLNDSLTSWQIPDNAFTTTEAVTLRRVLSHTAGMNNSGFFGYAPGLAVPSLLQLLDGLSPANHPAIRVIQTPGASWLYSGGAYTVLAQVIQDLTGQSHADWVLWNVLVPTGLWDSRFTQPSIDPRTVGTSIGSVLGIPIPASTYPEGPAAGLWTNALDLGRLVVAVQRSLAGEPDALLEPATAALMVTPEAPALLGLTPDDRMGLGFFLASGADPDWFWHTGQNVGFSCLVVGDTQGLGLGVAVMTNASLTGTPLAWEVANAIADIYGWPDWPDWGI